jgi:hypothetical protein
MTSLFCLQCLLVYNEHFPVKDVRFSYQFHLRQYENVFLYLIKISLFFFLRKLKEIQTEYFTVKV